MTVPALSNRLKQFSSSVRKGKPRHLGRRHDDHGVFLKEPGNTIVCHLIKGSAAADAIIKARSAMQELPEADKLAFTPISSLHMTLFQGIIEFRRAVPYWPEDVPLETSIDKMTALYHARLKDFEAPSSFNLAVGDASPNGLVLKGASAADETLMTVWRDRLAKIFGYRHPDHDSYEYHVTFAYIIEWMSDEALLVWQEELPSILEDVRKAAPVFELEPPAFCSFEDMKHFEKLLILD